MHCTEVNSFVCYDTVCLCSVRLMFFLKANSLTHNLPQDIINVAINAAYVALTLNLES